MNEYLKDFNVRMDNGGNIMMQNWTPAYLQETSKGMEHIRLMDEHFTNRKVFITGEVSDCMANELVSQMLYLCKSDEPVDIIINSPGGSVNAGLVIYDMIQCMKEKVTVNMYCVGMAASMGAIIFAGGTKGRRYILPHSEVMIHEPLISGGVGGSASSIKKRSDMLLETRKITAEILSKHTGKSYEEICEAIAYDNFMNAQQAIEFGIADEIKFPL